MAMHREINFLEMPDSKRDYEFVLQHKRDAEKQAGLARTCEWRIDAATGEEADAIADAADKAATIAGEQAAVALRRAQEAAGEFGSEFGELSLHAAAETVHAAANAQQSARIVNEHWMANALAAGEDAL